MLIDDARTEHQAEVPPGSCIPCMGTGQSKPPGLGGAWGECPACEGTGQVEIPERRKKGA